MNDPRRTKVSWGAWRWRLSLLLPAMLFALLAASSLREFRTEPIWSLVFGVPFLALAMLFARQLWRERHPLHSEVRRRNPGSDMPDQHLHTFLVLIFAIAVGCDRREQQPAIAASATAPTSQPDVQWVDPSTIQPGPIQRDTLTPQQMERVQKLQAVFVEVDGQSVEQWVDSFKRDLNPDRELDVWEAMAKAYTTYCSKRTLSAEAKKEVYQVVLLRSMASEKDVLERLDLKVLSKDEAVAVMRGF